MALEVITPERNPLRAGATVTRVAGFVRPADTTTYAAGDVVCSTTTAAAAVMLEFQNMARKAGYGGVIESAVLIDSAAPTLKIDSELYLFDRGGIIMQADNAAFNPTDDEVLASAGFVPFATGDFKVMGANGQTHTRGIGAGFTCAPNATSLWGILVVRNAYVPVSGEQFTIKLQVLQD